MNWDQEKVDRLLANFGGSHFLLQRNGEAFVVVGEVNFPLHGQHIFFGPSDFDVAQAAITEAQAKAKLIPNA